MFTKHLEGLDLQQIIDGLLSAGMQGADLCVRPGYPVNPENAAKALPEAAKRFADVGLAIPLVTSPGDFTRPDMDYAESLYEACGKSGVKHIKLGYWHWRAGDDYWEMVKTCKGYLEGFQKLSEQTGVQSVVHNHSGQSMGLNSSAVMHLVDGFDPKHVGVFADAGHLSICGEPIEMALNIVKGYVSVIALKDLYRQRVVREGRSTWQIGVARMGEGFVDWVAALKAIDAIGFDGPVSFHSEYGGEPPESVLDLARVDVRYIDRVRGKSD
jgi:sugar phosphate isomerase/epimerase